MVEETGIAVIDKASAIAIFTGDGLDAHLEKVRAAVYIENPDTSTQKGRDLIRSNARKASSAMARTEEWGLELGEELRVELKQLNESRNKSKDFFAALRDSTRQPLTIWEDAKKAREAAEKLAAEVESDHADAILEDKLFVLETAEAARVAEAERVRIEEEQQAEAERVRLARIEEDKRIAAEATAEAERVAADNARKEKAESERKLQGERDKAEKAKRDKIAAEERAKLEKEQVEIDRKAAAEKAEQERLAAIKRTKDEAEELARQKEEDRLLLEKIERTKTEKKAADKENQRKKNRDALAALQCEGFDEATAKLILTAIIAGKIYNVSMNY